MIEHAYPFCWRCGTPLLYYARSAWYVRTTAMKERLLEVNDAVNWVPDHIKHGRYGNWLENNVDWALSRERYWGTPLPIWRCAAGHQTAIGSLTELGELAGRDVRDVDPHRPAIDEVTFPCPECGETATRVNEVIDTWYDSGAMPFAQWSYHPELGRGEALFAERFPADFITEAIDQTRGWFYTLMAEGVLHFDSTAYRNVVCLGHLVATDGRKMSKSLGNALDPWEVLDRQGADALRWWMITNGSPWESRRIGHEVLDEIVRQFMLTLWNVYAFFVTYANAEGFDPSEPAPPVAERPRARPLGALAARGHGANAPATASRRTTPRARAGGSRRSSTTCRTGTSAARAGASGTRAARRRRRRARRVPHVAHVPRHGGAAAGARSRRSSPRSCGGTSPPIATARPMSVHLRTTRSPTTPRSTPVWTRRWPPRARSSSSAAGSGSRRSPGRGSRCRRPSSTTPATIARSHRSCRSIADELNVKRVVFAESDASFGRWRAKPNYKVLGPKLGARVKDVAAALATDDGDARRRRSRAARR